MPAPLDQADIDRLFGPTPAPAPENDPFGRIGAGDPAWDRARALWLDGASPDDLFGGSQLDLNDNVGANQPNQRGDVFKLQNLMDRAGHLDASATGGPTGYWGGRDDAALRDLQKQNGLTVDGWASPAGETLRWLRDAYQRWDSAAPPDGRAAEVRAATARDLAGQLGLDPGKIDTGNPDVLPALGAVRFLRYSTGSDREKAMQKVLDLRASDPELAGRLHAMAAEIATQPQWHYDKMTPEELQQARIALDAADVRLTKIDKQVGPYLRGAYKAVDKWFFRPVKDAVVEDERRRLDQEMARRRDPRDR